MRSDLHNQVLKSSKLTNYKLSRLIKEIEIMIFVVSLFFFRLIREERRTGINSRYLTDEDFQIIKFFEDKPIKGLIYVPILLVDTRINAIGFLPIFYDRNTIGTLILFNSLNLHSPESYILACL